MTFASFKNARIVRSGWLEEGGRRLDCNPYMSGALEARDALRSLDAPKEELASVTAGIFHAGREGRLWADDPEFGVPFFGSSDVLNANLSMLPLLSKRQIERNPLFTLGNRWTLITRSGTIGRMAYVREEMVGLACSEHVLRVVPNSKAILPGYLFAFLSGRFGVPLVVSGTYGAIIQHIEAEHVSGLPVPRLGSDLEGRAHELIEGASRCRTEAGRLMRAAMVELAKISGLSPLRASKSSIPFSTGSVMASSVQARLDAFFHGQYHAEALTSLRGGARRACPLRTLVAGVEEPNRFKRVVLDSDSTGTPLFGTSAIFWNDPEPSYYLPQKLAKPYIVTRRTLLIPRSGQLSGVIGRVVLPYGDIVGGAVSEDAIRVHCQSENDAGFLFVFLSSEHGLRQLKARTFGSSIPHLDVRQIGSCLVPEKSADLWTEIGEMGLKVSRLRDEAIVHERSARAMVEKAISGGAT